MSKRIDREVVAAKLEQLGGLVRNMEIPAFRMTNVRWLKKHLAQRNSSHPDFEEAMKLVDELFGQGVR